MKKLTLIVILFFGLVAHSQQPKQLALDFIYELDTVPQKAYDSYLDTSFQNKVDVDQMVEMWGKIETFFGEFQSAHYICVDDSKENISVYATVNFKRKSQDLNIVFNDKNKIIGFFMAETIPCEKEVYPLPKYAKQKKYIETEIQFKSGDLTLFGTLTQAVKHKTNTPIVIFVHGSGPNDRDESIGPNKLFKDLALGIATKGISSLRYDKRTFRYKNPELSNTIQKEVTNDVTSAIKWLKQNENTKNNPIFVVGHSLGAYVAPLIANQNTEVKGIVMMAGNFRPLEELVLAQYQYISTLKGENEASLKPIIADLKVKLNYLKDSLTENSPPNKLPLGVPPTYWLSMHNYNHKAVIKNLSIPIFVMQGERDYQVTMTDFNLYGKIMAEKSNYTAKSYKNLNHLFLEGKGKPNPGEYLTQSNVPKYVLIDIVKWIKANI